jgi:hypothetical protein
LQSLVAGFLPLVILVAATGNTLAQTPGSGKTPSTQANASGATGGADRRDRDGAQKAARGADRPQEQTSQAFRESIRQTVERRRQRRARRGQQVGESQPVGAIITWPMQPALIIRQTPQVHDEIETLLNLLKK